MIGKRLFRVLFTFLGILCGVALAGLISYYSNILDTMPDISRSGLAVMASLMGIGTGLIFFLLSPKVARSTEYLTVNLESATQERPLREFVFGVIGLVVGLMIAFLISQTWANIAIPIIGLILSAIRQKTYCGWFLAGVGFMVVGSILQTVKTILFYIGPLEFNFNAIYHVFTLLYILCLFVGVMRAVNV